MNNLSGHPFMPVSPMLSYVPSNANIYGNMISQPSQHSTHFNFPWMKTGALSPNNYNQLLPGHPRVSTYDLTPNSPYFSSVPMTTSMPSWSSVLTNPLMTSAQHAMTSQGYRHHHYTLPTYSTGDGLQSLYYTL
ncbi:hypothetical protein DPMN_082490 [Dreissena polymorpha]|uniref:Uncharacterized protein n=1 Tax=Dreissena polymorpha TaxID=45954 RepID=A0A9D3YAV8_DREPO|nr:hypothetical protein DPMN_082490 [Dreissena polymorpha]